MCMRMSLAIRAYGKRHRYLANIIRAALFQFQLARFHLVRMSRISHSMRTCRRDGIFPFASNASHIIYMLFLFYFCIHLCSRRRNYNAPVKRNPLKRALRFVQFVAYTRELAKPHKTIIRTPNPPSV